MKKLILGFVAVIFLVVGLGGLSLFGPGQSLAQGGPSDKAGPSPVVVVANPMVKITKDAKVVILGSGFKPGQEIRILFKPLDGVAADIGYALKPEPVPNKLGAFVSTWTCGRHLRKNIKPGAFSLVVTDMEFGYLAQTPVAFYAESASEKKK
jgi:hypothetical protein